MNVLHKSVTLLITILCAFSASAATNQQATDNSDLKYIKHRSLLWSPGDDDSKFYRIPALATTDNGTIVAVADKRIDSNADLPGRIDVVCRTSTDNGKTWTPAVTVVPHDETGGYGDPALVVDKKSGDVICIMTHGNGLWQSTPDNHATVMVSRSSDNGATWSKPFNISDAFFSTDSVSDKPIKGITLFATSGKALQTEDGRLMFVAVVRGPKPKSHLYVQAVYSDDGGYTWTASPAITDNDGDESKIVELPDHRLLMSIRNRTKAGRKFSISEDRGETWSEPVVSGLNEPACNGDIINYTTADGKEYLLHSIPDSKSSRENVSVYASDDNGTTWHRLITVCPTLSAYSALTIAPDGSLGCLTEEEAHNGGYRLWYTSIDIEPLIADRFASVK